MDDRLDYEYGWSPKGTRCYAERLGHRTQRYSMVAAYCRKELIEPMTFSGHCKSTIFEAWFKHALLPKLKPKQVVILDNASFHRKKVLRAMLEEVDCFLLPLPPYSPQLNKIEHVWHQIKSIIKHIDDDRLSFREKIHQAFCSV